MKLALPESIVLYMPSSGKRAPVSLGFNVFCFLPFFFFSSAGLGESGSPSPPRPHSKPEVPV